MNKRIKILGGNLFFNEESKAFSLDKNALTTSFPFSPLDILPFVKPTAFTFCLAISDACNLNCLYCFNKEKSGKAMKYQQAVDALNKLFRTFPNGEKYFVDLSGIGEPLLNLDLVLKLSNYCHKKSDELKLEVLPQLVCNGTLLTRSVVDTLQKHGVLFGVSIDGNKDINDKYRGKGVYDRVIGILSAIENKDYIGCASTIGNEVFPLLESIDELGKTFKTLSYRLCRGDGFRLNAKSARSWKKEYERVGYQLLSDIRQNYIDRFLLLMNGDDWFGRFLCKAFGKQKTINRCDAGIARFAVGINGDIYPCSASIGIGAPMQEGELSKNAEAQQYRQALICQSCPYKFYCGGPCPIEENEIGKANKAECYLAAILIELSFFLSLTCERENKWLFRQLSDFVKEKSNRHKADPELMRFLANNPNLAFTEAKKIFDELNKRR